MYLLPAILIQRDGDADYANDERVLEERRWHLVRHQLHGPPPGHTRSPPAPSSSTQCLC
ncbi:hypothetical protein B0H12DRAFT_1103953 [Mycena haematopus]|nr:hypothetical protein B0H12DRAFT_1103953 [Mycena haematopus]